MARFDALADPLERARALTDLVVTSVLLDAGAGAEWHYVEPETGLRLQRSEGLALASHHCFVEGMFSSDPTRPLQADAKGLEALTAERLGRAFQVDAQNPLLGLDGRATLLQKLGRTLRAQPEQFAHQARVGGLCDVLVGHAQAGRCLQLGCSARCWKLSAPSGLRARSYSAWSSATSGPTAPPVELGQPRVSCRCTSCRSG